MSLLLRQIVYTSFPGIGFKTVASEQVSPEIQQAFIGLISQHWEVYNPHTGYQAAYLYQLTPKDNLFGWLYNNRTKTNDKESIHRPYFICYYLDQTLNNAKLEIIFTCLERGPVTLIDQHNPSATSETLFIQDCWNYQPAAPGIKIPLNVRQQCQSVLEQGKLLDLFISDSPQEPPFEMKPRYEQLQVALANYTNYLAEKIEVRAVLARKTKVIQALENVVAGVRNKVVKASTPTKTELLEIVYPATNRSPGLQEITPPNSFGTDKNSRLIFIAIIFVVVVTPIAASIYGILRPNIPAPNHSQKPSVVNNPVFYKTFASVPNVPQGVFSYGGSTVFAALRSPEFLAAIVQAQPQFYLRYTEPLNNKPGSTTGIQMLIDGELSVAQSSRPLKDSEYKRAKTRGFTLEQIPVAIDGIAFFTNQDVNISELSVDQLQAIFTGKVTNWKQLGGSDLPIIPFSKPLENSTTLDILFAGAKDANLGNNVQQVRDITTSLRQVAATPGGIGYGTASEIVNQQTVHLLRIAKKNSRQYVSPVSHRGQINTAAFRNGTYPLTRMLFVVIRRDGQLNEQAGVAYANLLLSTQGQQLIEKVGFVPIHL